ncbi:MAG: hypothetical protein ACR2OD_11725 [Gaiellaceae bacterium]
MRSTLKRAAVGAAVLGVVAAVYRFAAHARLGRWGATPEEWSETLQGDEVVRDANHRSTRAVAIDATPAEIWPWLVQIGQGRGGAYTYERLQNLFRLDFHNADQILPEYQNLKIGDTIPLDPSGKGPKVRELVAEEHMLLEDHKPPWTWLFALHPDEPGRTRLVVRNRVSTKRSSLPVRALYRLLGPPVFLMERKMLLGIKERAERLHSQNEAETRAAARAS